MKNYFYTIFLAFIFGFCSLGFAQSSDLLQQPKTETIEGLSIYPNPVSNGKLYITTKSNLNKAINIYDVLGKKVMSTSLFGKELNIVKLTPGVYIIKIDENSITATRKLVVR